MHGLSRVQVIFFQEHIHCAIGEQAGGTGKDADTKELPPTAAGSMLWKKWQLTKTLSVLSKATSSESSPKEEPPRKEIPGES